MNTLKSSVQIAQEGSAPPPPPVSSEQQAKLDEILESFGVSRRALLNDNMGHLRFAIARALVDDEIFDGPSAATDADRFVALLLKAAEGSDLQQRFWDWILNTRDLVVQLEKVRAKRREVEHWHQRREGLNRSCQQAEKVLRYEEGRLAFLPDAAQRKEQLVADYLSLAGSDELVPDRFVQRYLYDIELFSLLRERVIPELQRRAVHARKALEDFEKTSPGQ